MDCQIDNATLVSFHFGLAAATEHHFIGMHLQHCSACLARFLALKSDIDLGTRDEIRPSSETTERVFLEAKRRLPRLLHKHPTSLSGYLWKKRRSLVLATAAALLFALVSKLREHHADVADTSMLRTLQASYDRASASPGHLNVL